MLRRVLIGLAFALAVVAACYAWPLSAVLGLKQALMARDADGVARHVDFVALKANVKQSTQQQIEKKDAGSFLAPLKDAVIGVIADDKLDRVATPAGMINLVCDQSSDGEGPPPGSSKPCELHGHMQYAGFRSRNRFAVSVRKDSGEEFTLVMARQGWHWVLVDLLKPQAETGPGTSKTVH
jgi:hypothetical protein